MTNDLEIYKMAWNFAMLQILVDKGVCTRDEFENMRLRKLAWLDQCDQKDKDGAAR